MQVVDASILGRFTVSNINNLRIRKKNGRNTYYIPFESGAISLREYIPSLLNTEPPGGIQPNSILYSGSPVDTFTITLYGGQPADVFPIILYGGHP